MSPRLCGRDFLWKRPCIDYQGLNPEAMQAFLKLKELIITAPVLKLPDPTKVIIVYVDAWDA